MRYGDIINYVFHACFNAVKHKVYSLKVNVDLCRMDDIFLGLGDIYKKLGDIFLDLGDKFGKSGDKSKKPGDISNRR